MSAPLPAPERGLPLLTCSAREQGETLLCFGNQVVVGYASAFVFGVRNPFALLFRRQCKPQTRNDVAYISFLNAEKWRLEVN